MQVELLKRGIEASRLGQLSRARTLVWEATETDPGYELAWLWRASLAPDAEEAEAALVKVLEINPENRKAQDWMDQLRHRRQVADSGSRCPFCGRAAGSLACAGCGAVLKVVEVDSFFSAPSERLDRALIASKIEILNQVSDPKASDCWTLGLAYLNLQHYEKALEWMRQACQLNGEDETLREIVDELVLRVHGGLQPIPDPQEPWEEMQLSAEETAEVEPVSTAAGSPDDAAFDRSTAAATPRAEEEVAVGGAAEQGLDGSQTGEETVPFEAIPSTDESSARQGQTHGTLGLDGVEDLAAERQRRRTVLVIDDSATIRKLVAMTLERKEYRVVSAKDGMEGLAKLQEARPDLILLDINMPHLDGYKLCRVIKDSGLREVPVVMLSGNDGFLDKVRGRMVGAAAYITKPVDPTILLQAVDKHAR